MKRNLLTMLLVGLCSLTASAHDFEYRGIFYNIISEDDLTVEVTFQGDSYDSYSHEYSGRAVFSSTVTYNGIIYSVTRIGDNAFSGCSSLTSITIPEGVTSIGENAFCDCSSLTTITVPESMTSIGWGAFDDYGITAVYINNISAWCNIEFDDVNRSFSKNYKLYLNGELVTALNIPEGVTRIGDNAFSGCSSLTSITIPEGVTSIGYYAFRGCSSLTDIDIPESVTSIRDDAFYNCSRLTSITIPKNVTDIAQYAFSGCYSLTSITCEALVPPLTYRNAFRQVSTDIPIYVPAASLEEYKLANDWGYFNNFIALEPEPDPEHTITYTIDGEFFKSESLLPGTPITLPEAPTKEGYVFSGWVQYKPIDIKGRIKDMTNPQDEVLYTNAPCTNTSYGDEFESWDVLFDGNANTFFHSEYSDIESLDGLDHYLRVDAGKAIRDFSFTYMVRGNDSRYTPSEIVVEGANEPNGTYTEISVLTDLPGEMAAVYESPILSNGNAYRYIRFRVTKTLDNITVHNHPYFYFAAFGMSKPVPVENLIMPAEDIVIHGSFVERTNQTILDTAPTYAVAMSFPCPAITYTRNFADTEWQPLYVPFEIAYEEICNDFEVAYIYNTRQYDHDEDGVKDETIIEAFKMKEGMLEANYPYLIRAKEAGEKSIVVTDATLYATEENTIDCASVFDTYTFKGTYSQLSSTTLTPGEGYYTLVGGEWQPVTESTTLGAFRFYLKVDSRHGAPAAEARSIRMRFVGENNNDDDATGIENAEIKDEKSGMIYDLQGRRVEKPTKGMYIVNGKKVVIK